MTRDVARMKQGTLQDYGTEYPPRNSTSIKWGILVFQVNKYPCSFRVLIIILTKTPRNTLDKPDELVSRTTSHCDRLQFKLDRGETP